MTPLLPRVRAAIARFQAYQSARTLETTRALYDHMPGDVEALVSRIESLEEEVEDYAADQRDLQREIIDRDKRIRELEWALERRTHEFANERALRMRIERNWAALWRKVA